jgi:hypothetical protein
MAKKIAWQIDDIFEGTSTFVFHHHGLAARREGANELDLDFEDVECSRKPYFDEYAEQGFVPREVLLDNGWWFECNNCSKHITEYNVYKHNIYYCSFKCWMKDKIRELKLLFVPKKGGPE